MPLPVWDPPADDLIAAPFWEAARDGRCVLPRCSRCGRWLWYPDAAGPDCPGASIEWAEIDGRGTVYSFTIVRRSFLPDQRGRAPYAVVLVDLDAAPGVRLVGNLPDDVEPRIGQRVAFGVRTVEGRAHPVFEPLEA